MQALMKEFRTFLLRGNLVDMAVGIVTGLTFTIHKSRFLYGDFINALITFVSIAAAVFFFVVKPVNMLMARRKTEPPVDETTRPCPECLSEIPSAARRCAFCTAQLAAVTYSGRS